MELQVGVKVLLQNSSGRFLLLERSLEKYSDIPQNQRWDIVGGRIQPGISLLENIQREVYEETKLKLIDEPQLFAAQDILRQDKHVVRLTYLGHIRGEPTIDEEHKSFGWFTLEEIKQMENLDSYFREVFSKLSLLQELPFPNI